jgi:lipoate-protein ligase B
MAENKVHLLLGESQTVWDVGHDLTIVVPLHGIVLNVRSTLHQFTHVNRNSPARDLVSAGQRNEIAAVIAFSLRSSSRGGATDRRKG